MNSGYLVSLSVNKASRGFVDALEFVRNRAGYRGDLLEFRTTTGGVYE